MIEMVNHPHWVNVPLRFYPTATLEQYQRFFEDSPVCVGIDDAEYANTGAYVTLEYEQADHKAVMKWIKNNSTILEIDMDTLAEMKD